MVFKEKRTIAFVIIVISVFLSANYLRIPRAEKKGEAYVLPLTIGQWEGSEVQYNRELLTSWLGTQAILFRSYKNETRGYDVTVYIAYYDTLDSSDMAHAPEVCYPGQGWKITSSSDVPFVLSGNNARVKRMVIEKDSAREVVYSWWETGNRVFPYNSWYHLYQILNKFTFKDTSSIWVRISSETNGDSGQGEEMIRLFCKDAAPLLANYFREKI